MQEQKNKQNKSHMVKYMKENLFERNVMCQEPKFLISCQKP